MHIITIILVLEQPEIWLGCEIAIILVKSIIFFSQCLVASDRWQAGKVPEDAFVAFAIRRYLRILTLARRVRQTETVGK